MSTDGAAQTYIVVLREGISKKKFIDTLESSIKENSWITVEYEYILNGFCAKLRDSDADILKRHPDVEIVEKDGVGYAQAYQNDATWGLGRLSRIAPFSASDRPSPNKFFYHWDPAAGSGVDIYIVGVDTTHPAFEGRASWGKTIAGTDKKDVNGHGTHVAGTAISKQLGVARAANVIAVKIMEQDTYSYSDLIKGLDYIIDNTRKTKRPSVVNMSIAGPQSDAIDASVKKLFDELLPVVVSAGNENKDAGKTSPARSPYAITVGACNIRDSRWAMSNYGRFVNVFAPGEDVDSTWIDGGTKVLSGTSMAAPHVSGLLAYLLSTRTKVPLNFWVYAHVGILKNIPDKTLNLLIYNNHYDLTGQKLEGIEESQTVSYTGGERTCTWGDEAEK